MKTKMRYLRNNKSSAMPTKMLFLDSETKPIRDRNKELLKMIICTTAYVDTRSHGSWETPSWNTFYEPLELAKYVDGLCKNKNKLYIFAHNVFFDVQACSLFLHLGKLNWTLSFIHDKMWNYILCCFKGEQSLCFLSTTNFYTMSLKELGKELKLPKLDIDFSSYGTKEMELYNRRDVEIIVKAMKRYIDFLTKHDCGKFGLTRSSQAFHAYRHRFMTTKICVHESAEVKILERFGYYGGRNECFEIGTILGKEFVTIDVNSMYPYVMSRNQFPTKLKGTTEQISIEELGWIIEDYDCIALVMLETAEPVYPYRENNKLLFPVGRFQTYLSTPELIYAVSKKHVKTIYQCAFYEHDNIFADYVAYFYNLKQQAKRQNNKMDAVCTKIFLNSMYGKFGQLNDVEKITSNFDNEKYYKETITDLEDGTHKIVRDILGKNIVTEGKEDADHTFTAIAACVTAQARMLLWKTIKKIGVNKIFYCDTDSIILRKKDLLKSNIEIDNFKLGAWSIEDEYDDLEITTCKHYTAGEKKVIKGIPKDAEKIGKNLYRYWQWCGQATHLEQGQNSGFIRELATKRVSGEYDKGHVTLSGRVKPIQIIT